MAERDRARGSEDAWTALVLEVPERLDDELAGALAGLCRGAEARPRPAGRVELRLYLSSAAAAPLARARLDALLELHGLDAAAANVRSLVVHDERWVERYQESLRPFPLGRGFRVEPAGGESPADGRQAIRIVPGQAFGTGEHATTQLCVLQLERLVRPESRWLDLGCGTAILSIVAQHLGAGELLALDLDPLAIAVAERVLCGNGLQGRIELGCGSLAAAGSRPWDGIVCNIGAEFLVEHAEALAARLAPRGWLVAAGFLVDDLPRIVEALERAGLAEGAREQAPPWAMLAARSPGEVRD